MSTNALKRTDAQRAGRGRFNPRLAIIDFQGSSTRIAKPLVAWMTSDHRAGAVAYANATQPVKKAATRRPSKARLVRLPTLVGAACRAFIT
jgi:hypothetical protein